MPIERYRVAGRPHAGLVFIPTGERLQPLLSMSEALALVERLPWPGEGTMTGWSPYAFRVGKHVAAEALVKHLEGHKK